MKGYDNMQELRPLETCSRYQLRGDEVFDGNAVVGTWHPNQSRIDWSWSSLGIDPSLIEMAREESKLWDDWAEVQAEADSPLLNDSKRFSLSGWLNRYPNIAGALGFAGISLDLGGKTLLDVGGSGKDMIYWLKENPARIDHVEVSPKSQFLCAARIRSLANSNTDETTSICYHTIPAEKLPFDDAVFDFAFSRSTIHHCKRPDVFAEIVRVLKPGGILLFVEPHLSGPMYWLMRTRRILLNLERGTDDPLRPSEMSTLVQLLAAGGGMAACFYSRSLLHFVHPKGRAENWSQAPTSIAMNVAFAGRKAYD